MITRKYQLTQSKKEILLEVGKNAQARKPIDSVPQNSAKQNTDTRKPIDSVMSTIDKTNHNTRDTIAYKCPINGQINSLAQRLIHRSVYL